MRELEDLIRQSLRSEAARLHEVDPLRLPPAAACPGLRRALHLPRLHFRYAHGDLDGLLGEPAVAHPRHRQRHRAEKRDQLRRHRHGGLGQRVRYRDDRLLESNGQHRREPPPPGQIP